MPNLSELTDYQPEPQVTPQGRLYVSPNMPTSDDGDYFTKPVAPMPELPADNVVERIIKKLAETDFSGGTDIGNKLTGAGGQERYQLWPEKIVRSALTAIPDAYSGKIPMHDVDPETGELVPSQAMIGRAMDMASFAGAGGIAGTGEGGVALGAGPSLRPALKYKDRLYKGKEGQQHQDVIPPHLYPEFQDMAMKGEDISHYNFGFVNDKGHFLSREDALKYGIDSGLIDPQAGKFGALTSTLMANSSKPGTAIEAMAKTAQPFYSALEHNVNAISQNKMNGEAWLGTLANKPGVKPEELDWTGLRSFLEENKGKPVTKEQVQEHLASNKVELKEVKLGKPSDLEEAKAQYEKTGKDWNNLPLDLQQKYTDIISRAQAPYKETKYHSYQLHGGENYKEMLMTLPPGNAPFSNIYKSSHWDEPNILAHVRMNDRTIDGKKSLHLEEIQSDWHQQGRDKEYKVAQPLTEAQIKRVKEIMPKLEEMRRKGASLEEVQNTELGKEASALQDIHREFQRQEKLGSVPDAPFKKTWHELALKRMLREAAEKGYDRLSWTSGEHHPTNPKNLKQTGPEADNADKGMRGFYNDILPKTVEKIGKEHGVKVKSHELETNPKGWHITPPTETVSGKWMVKSNDYNSKGWHFDTKAEAEANLAQNIAGERGTKKIHYIDIPQSLKDRAMQKGFPLFSGGYIYTPVDGNPFKDQK